MFEVVNWHETRNDKPTLHGYRVILDNVPYIVYYDDDQLREVYFINRFKNYVMSCRTDFKTLSHYYVYSIDSPIRTTAIVKRYENNILTGTYLLKGNTTICNIGSIRRVYTATNTRPDVNSNKLQADLCNFLDKFYELGLDCKFAPMEL